MFPACCFRQRTCVTQALQVSLSAPFKMPCTTHVSLTKATT